MQEFLENAKLNYKSKKMMPITFSSSVNLEECNTFESICNRLGIAHINIEETVDLDTLLQFITSYKEACHKYSYKCDMNIEELLQRERIISEYKILDEKCCRKEIELSYFFNIEDYKDVNINELRNEYYILEREKNSIQKLKNKNILCGAIRNNLNVINFIREENYKNKIRQLKPSIIRDILILIIDNHSIKMNDLVNVLRADRITVLKVIFYFRDTGLITHDVSSDTICLNI
ncbi:hypothetical protein H312_03271 [Anncaliia algerae PRA339]|uniref:Uncharacterized protein n=1 Tax=Anncaliia algerae PRA339 TaxID=1288291 RepID=A0A059EX80_9MICR|nr:hypothetical protein H312_03271 [Anncaliia algerae PRA339]